MTDRPTTAPGWRRWGARALHALAASALLGFGWLHLPAAGEAPLLLASPHDLVLDGPDAGEWAANALFVHHGRWEDLDLHRMPTWLMAVALALHVQPDVALAGHLVNHLAMLALPLVVYALGQRGAGPAAGLAAGVTVAACAPLVLASRRYGVDPLVALLLPLALAAALPVRRRWWLAPLAGAVGALASLTHFTALPYALPPLLLLALGGPRGWRRPLALLLYAGSAALVVAAVARVFPLPDPDALRVSVSEGVSKGAEVGAQGLAPEALQRIEVGAAGAVHDAVAAALRPFWAWWLPWGVLLVAPWLGVAGPGLGGGPAPGLGGVRRLLAWTDPALGLALLSCLAPLPLLAAAGAEPRYAANLLPFVALLVVRGLLSPFALADGLLARRWPPWPRGLLVALPAVTACWTAWHVAAPLREEPLPPLFQHLAARELGELVARLAPGPGGAACPSREALAHAGRDFCPGTRCPDRAEEGAYLACVEVLRRECGGEGPIPYVAVEAWDGPVGDAERAMGAWLRARHGTAGTLRRGPMVAHVVLVPREDL